MERPRNFDVLVEIYPRAVDFISINLIQYDRFESKIHFSNICNYVPNSHKTNEFLMLFKGTLSSKDLEEKCPDVLMNELNQS
jgi:hypothetical protein